MSRSMVVIELVGDAPLPRDLAAGGVFVPDCALRLAEECDLVVCGASHQLMIRARVVYVDPQGGAGLELLGFSPEMMAQLAELATPALAAALPARGLDDAAQGSSNELDAWSDPDAPADGCGDDPEIPSARGTRGAVAFAGGGAGAGAAARAVITRVRHGTASDHGATDDGALDEDDDLAIPVSAEDTYDAIEVDSEASARPGDAVFAYAKPGLAYRGGVARRAESESGEDVARSRAAAKVVARPGLAGGGRAGSDVDFASALGAELDAELAISDLADADADPAADREARGAQRAPRTDDAPACGGGDEGLELELIGPAAVTAAQWEAAAARAARAALDEDASADGAWARGEADAGDADGAGGLAGDAYGEGGTEGEGGGAYADDDRGFDRDDVGGEHDAGDGDAARATGAGEAGDPRDPRARPGGPPGSTSRFARNVHERLRGLTLAMQIKVAAQGELHERIVLERLYGKNVWETLLRNPRLTAPEVSRIARFGALPRVLLEVIVGNNAWLQIPEVRRALLSNPRLGVDQIMKVLRLTPKHELRLAAIQTAYPHAVRNAAKVLMHGDP